MFFSSSSILRMISIFASRIFLSTAPIPTILVASVCVMRALLLGVELGVEPRVELGEAFVELVDQSSSTTPESSRCNGGTELMFDINDTVEVNTAGQHQQIPANSASDKFYNSCSTEPMWLLKLL